MESTKRIGVIGVGRIGTLHARLLHEHPNATVASIADVDLQRATELARELGVGHVTDDPAALLAQLRRNARLEAADHRAEEAQDHLRLEAAFHADRDAKKKPKAHLLEGMAHFDKLAKHLEIHDHR